MTAPADAVATWAFPKHRPWKPDDDGPLVASFMFSSKVQRWSLMIPRG